MINWLYLITPLHKTVSSNSKYGQVKAALREIDDKCQQVVENGMTVKQIVQDLKLMSLSHEAKKAVDAYDELLKEADEKELEDLRMTMVKGVTEMIEKLQRDAPLMRALDCEHDERVPYTNRRVESVFAVYKALHKRLMQLSPANKAAITRARMNDTTGWMSAKKTDERMEQLKMSQMERQRVIKARIETRKRWEKEIEEKYFKDLDSLLQKENE